MILQELEPAHARPVRVLRGDILSAECHTQLHLGGGGATDKIKQQLLEIRREKGVAAEESESAECKSAVSSGATEGAQKRHCFAYGIGVTANGVNAQRNPGMLVTNKRKSVTS
jgi:hypothetical protein